MRLAPERLSLKRWGPSWVRYQHLARYEWVAGQIGGLDVIDAACGTGYGARMLLDAGAHRVMGFDSSEDAIKESRKDFQTENLTFTVADVARLTLPDHCCDAYVSFETIEHLADHHAFLRESRRVLRPGGKFFCSTPNRDLGNPGTSITDRPYNIFHFREYTVEEFAELLRIFYPQLEIFGQSFYSPRYRRLLERVGRLFPRLAVRMHQFRKLFTSPLDSIQRHWPCPMDGNRYPEILVAIGKG